MISSLILNINFVHNVMKCSLISKTIVANIGLGKATLPIVLYVHADPAKYHEAETARNKF